MNEVSLNRVMIFAIAGVLLFCLGFALGWLPRTDRLRQAEMELEVCRQRAEDLQKRQQRVEEILRGVLNTKDRDKGLFKSLLEILK